MATQQQRDDWLKEAFCRHAIEYGLQYYIAGRFAVHAQFAPVCANLLHHAVELLIKGILSTTDTAAEIRGYGYRNSYGHKLHKAWQELKRRTADPAFDVYDDVIVTLDQFEDIRYPDTLIERGALINVGLADEPPTTSLRPGPVFNLSLPQIDRLVKLLFDQSGMNPEFFRLLLQQGHAAPYHTANNASPLR